MILTQKGRELYPKAARIIAELDELDSEARSTVSRFKVASTEANAVVRGAKILAELESKFAQIKFEMITKSSLECLEALRDYEVEVAFVGTKFVGGEDLLCLNKFYETMILASAKNAPSRAKKGDKSDADEVFFTQREGCTYSDFLAKYLSERDIELKISRITNYAVILDSVARGARQDDFAP